MILSIMAITFGVQGRREAAVLERSGYGKVGKTASIWAIVLGIIGCIGFLVVVTNYANNLR
jgi:hypothetical protein